MIIDPKSYHIHHKLGLYLFENTSTSSSQGDPHTGIFFLV